MSGLLRLASIVLVALSSVLLTSTALAQTGKIAGTVTDAATGEPLIGVNVVIEGTTQGSVTNMDGYYVILNVKPGTYALRASYIGFTPVVAREVRVNIDQTTTLDFQLQESVIEGEEVVVTATRPVVQPDVSASLANIPSEEIEALPVSSIQGAVGLQAGIQGLSVRGGSTDELNFMVNGMTFRDERDNTPFVNISLAAIEEIQVQTGGFNAEYGNVRSGVINVVTKEGGRSRYDGSAIMRYSPPAQKHAGPLANDPNAYWIRPFIDPDVAFVGTENGGWDEATRSQYPEFEGWNAVAEERLQDDDPNNDLSPTALQQAFLWQHRKNMEIIDPDYTLDVGFGGPLVPGFNEQLGDARFFFSYRRNQSMYLVPLSQDRYLEESGHLKVTSDIARGMKLSLEGLLGESSGTAASRFGGPGLFTGTDVASQLSPITGGGVGFIDTRIFAEDYWAPSTVKFNMLGAKFTHSLGQNSFYELRFTRFGSRYDTTPGARRDTTAAVVIGGVGFDEGPFGFEPRPTFGVDGMRMGVGMSNARDTSRVTLYNLKADFTSQVNRYLQVKTGIEYNITNSEVNYGSFDEFLPTSNTISQWDRTPTRGALYGQGKLEFQGMIANLGVRLDYFNAGGDWFAFDPFTEAFTAANAEETDSLLTEEPTDHLFALSPRVGVSFPVTEFSKLFFNYGHFRSLPDPNSLFLFRRFTQTGQVARVADPNNPLPKTVAYEVGYEHSILQQFLVRLAGYYKDVTDEPKLVNYVSRDGQTDYFTFEPNFYQDIRGFELTFARNRGDWLQGFVNYTYLVTTSGYFGFEDINENRTIQRQIENSDAARRDAFTRPIPRPYARLNLDVLVPPEIGPSWAGVHPLGDWRVSFIGRWQDGGKITWTGGGSIPGVTNNVDRVDFWNLDLRFTKRFSAAGTDVQFFVDVFNALDIQRLSFSGFVDGNDYNAYLRSLHLPERPGEYNNIPGDDKVGTYRDYDVDYVPMPRIESRMAVNNPSTEAIYYEAESESYIVFQDGAWAPADQSRVDQVLDDKAYIDMPNMRFLAFLNPRDIYFGFRVNF